MSRIVIRPMTKADLPAVCEVDRQCFSTPWLPEIFAAECVSPVGHYRVAECEGRIIGYMGAQIITDEAHVLTVGVDPEYRRRRIGERLLAEMMDAALRAGCRRITLEVREGNTAARQLYQKYGFAPVSLRKGYYTDPEEDAVVMWIEDTSRSGFRTLFEERLAELERED